MYRNFSKYNVKVIKHNQILIEGERTSNGLWNIPLSSAPASKSKVSQSPIETPAALGVIRLDKTKQELAQYYAATLFNPRKSTLLKALANSNFDSWPDFSQQLIRKHLPNQIESAQGHMDQEPKNLRSTKAYKDRTELLEEANDDTMPSQENNNIKTNDIMCTIMTTEEFSKSYSDQTGKFPITSLRGHKYIFVFYHYDTNTIYGHAIKNRNTETICDAWRTCYDMYKSHGEAPNLHILDNECSDAMKAMFRAENVTYQLVPPHIHRRNAAERAIRTYKNHLIAGLFTCDDNFPSREWDRLLPQANITINLLRQSRRNPSLSAYAALHGNYNFNATPMAPPGTKVVVHEKPKNRKTFAGHGTEAWYIGPSPDHYRCYKCYMPETCRERDADTVEFFPQKIPFPQVTTDDYLRQAATDIHHILKSDQPKLPTLQYGTPVTNAYIQVAQILKRATQQHKPIPETIVKIKQSPRVTDIPLSPVPSPRVVKALTTESTTPPRVKKVKDSNVSHHTKIHNNPMGRALRGKHQHPLVQARLANQRKLRPTASRLQRLVARSLHKTPQFQAQAVRKIEDWMCHVYHPLSGDKQSLDQLLKGNDAGTWQRSLSNEIGRLAQGVGDARPPSERILGTNTLIFIPKREVPSGRKITYINFV